MSGSRRFAGSDPLGLAWDNRRHAISLTFLGASRTVTGSKYLLDTGEARVLIDCRALSGTQRAARVELEGPADSGVVARRGRPDPRASRPRRLPAARRHAGVLGAGVLHGRHEGSVPHRAARRRTYPGRGRGQRQPPRFLEAPAGAAALHRGRCLPCRLAAPAGRLRTADARGLRRRSGLHRRRPSPRLCVRARSRRRQDDSVWRRSGPLRSARST